MQKNLTIILVILLCSCGDDSSTNPSSEYHTDDQQFIDDLADANGIANIATIKDRITPVEVDSG
ncbi:MAG: hypothetical protein QF856_06375, partial [Candidatus Marinimicrobia bacterium]|nr:hypothetical protein [Candidatus Neomarinimicrobiota bacterium]